MAAAPPPRPPRQRSGAEANNGNSNDAPTSRQLDFYQAMSDFRHMFPNMDEEVIEAVLRANNGAVDETIDQLLTMNIDEKQDESAAETLPQPQTVRLTDPGSSTTDPQEQTESSDSESIDLVDDISRSPEVNIAIPRPRPRVSRDPETTVPKNNDAVHNATNMLSQSSVDRGDLDFIGSSSVRINPQSNINEQFSSSSSAQTPSVQSKSPSNWGGDMLLDFSDPIEEIGATAFEPGKEHSAKPDSLRNVVENDLSPVNSESSAPAMPPKMLLLGNRRYASSTHWSPQKPPLEQQWRKWDPPMLGDLPDDFLRITFQPPLPRHRSNVHSDFYGPEHVNKSQLAGRGLVLTTDDVNHNTRHRYPVDDSMMTSSGSSRPHRVPPSRSQSMRTPSQHHSKTLDGSSRASKRSSLGAPPTSSCTFNSGAMPIRSISPAGLHSDSLINDPTSTAAKTRTWSPIRGKHKPKQPLPSQHADHHHHHLMGSTPPTPTSTANHGHHIPHSATRSTNHTTTRSTSHINDSTSHQNSTPSSGSHRSNPSQHAAQHAAAQQQALDSRVLQQRIVENARKRSAVSSNTNPEHVQYLEDEQLALMLQNDEFLAILMSDNDFVQALERDRMNATAFEPGPDSTVHADSCPLSNNPTPDSRFGDNGSLGSPVSSDEHMEFRRRLELMGGSSKTKFATIARKFFSRKKKKSPMKFKGPSLRSNIAPSTANLLEEDEDGELDHRDEVEDSSDERQQSY